MQTGQWQGCYYYQWAVSSECPLVTLFCLLQTLCILINKPLCSNLDYMEMAAGQNRGQCGLVNQCGQ